MDIAIHPEFLERIKRIIWFSHVFEPLEIETPVPHFYARSWKEVNRLLYHVRWGMMFDDAGSVISSHVALTFPEMFQTRWNEIAAEVYAWGEAEIRPIVEEIQHRHELNETFTHSITASMRLAVIEDVYRDTNHPSHFFSELLKFYEAGHFPCGWTGRKWPQGQLAVA